MLTNVSSSILSLIIAGGAHHLDLRSSNPADPQSVIDVRRTQKNMINTWLYGPSSSFSLPTKWIAALCIVGTALFMTLLYYFCVWYEKVNSSTHAPIVTTTTTTTTKFTISAAGKNEEEEIEELLYTPPPLNASPLLTGSANGKKSKAKQDGKQWFFLVICVVLNVAMCSENDWIVVCCVLYFMTSMN